MKPILSRFTGIRKLLILTIFLAGCTHVVKKPKLVKKPKPRLKPLPMLRSLTLTNASKKSYLTERSYLADRDTGYYLVAGRYVWIFYDDYMIIKSALEETQIRYESDKPPGECVKNPSCTTPCLHWIDDYQPDCVPRTIFGQRNRDGWKKRYLWNRNRSQGFWVLKDRVVVTLGDMQYYYKYDGTFIERKRNEKDWDLKIGPYAKYAWKIERTKEKVPKVSKVHFNDFVFDAESVRFSGPWVAITQKNTKRKNEHDFVMIDRTTGKEKARHPVIHTRLRTVTSGFYIDEKVKRAPDKPWLWYGKTVVNLRDEDPQKYCYAFKGKKKCVLMPKMSPTKKRCFPNRKCVPRPQWAEIYGMIETDDFIVKELPGKIVEITYDKKNYYTKTHHFTDERFKRHLSDYLFWRKMWRNIPVRKPRQRKK